MLKKILTLGLIVGLTALWALPALRPGTAALPGPVYEGICELWQVDLFEGGRGSRAGFLREAAADFCQEHPGSLVMVRALTGEEAVKQLSEGHLPDLISASAGLLSVFLPYLRPYEGRVSVRDEFAEAGTLNGQLMALAWATGGYALFCREDTLTAAGMTAEDFQKDPLSKALIPGKGRLLAAGYASGTNPYAALRRLTDRADPGPQLGQEEAFKAFLRGESGVLLGTQRDLVRLSDRVSAGREGTPGFVPVEGYTDLVTAVGLVKGEGSAEVAAAFAEYLTGPKVQAGLYRIGLFPVDGSRTAGSGMAARMEEALAGPLIVPGLFRDPAVLEEDRSKDLAALTAGTEDGM